MKLRDATPDDVDFILEQEARADFADYLYRWPREQHLAALEDPDHRVLLAEDETGPLAYVILSGLTAPEHSVELKRIAVAEPGRGLGQSLLRAVICLAFEDVKAERLWLDVFADNPRARAAYHRVGFLEDGVEHESDQRPVPLVVMSISADRYRAPAG